MIYNLPDVNTLEDCQKLFPDVITISKYNTYEKFDELYYKIYMLACAMYKKPLCDPFRIRFKFYSDSERIHQLSVPKFLLNINAWRPLIELKTVESYYADRIRILDEGFIVSIMMNNRLRVGLESKVLKVLTDYGITFERYSELIKIVIERYQELAREFTSLDIKSVMTLESIFLNDYRSSEKIRELNNLVVPETLQTAEVESLLSNLTKELINEFKKTNNPIWYISQAGKHIKEKQVQELFISYGQIPDVSGIVIPYTMKGNGFATGYIDPVSYYIAATGSLLSLIMNKSYMGDAGYLSRNLMLLSRTLTLSKHVFDCGTKHLIKYHVNDSDFLHALENKWATDCLGKKLEKIEYAKHKHWIGKDIWVRHIATCCLGNECCHVCYGGDSHLVMNMPGMAIFNTEVYSEPVSQDILSTRHLLFTRANKLEFSKSFHKYLKYISGDIYIKSRNELNESLNTDNLSIRIPEEGVTQVNKNDITEYSTFGNHVESPLYVYNAKTNEYDKIIINNYETIFIDADSMNTYTIIEDNGKRYYDISFETISSELEERVMSIDIKNNGLTDDLHAIMKLLDNASAYEDINELSQYFLEMLLRAGVRCRSVQSEIIINRLIRDANDIYRRPDFSQFKVPEYKILTLNKALLNNPWATIGFAYQENKRQILSDAVYNDKDEASYLDPMYAQIVSTEKLKRLHQKLLDQRLREENEANVDGREESRSN